MNPTNIPSPRSDFAKPEKLQDGTTVYRVTREWYMFLVNLFEITGGGASATTIPELAARQWNTTNTMGMLSIEGEPGEDGLTIVGPRGIQGLPGLTIPGVDGQDGEDAFPLNIQPWQFDASGAAAAVQANLDTHTALTGDGAHGLGTISTQDDDSVNIDGGAIDGTAIGANSAAAGRFTTVTTTGQTTEQTKHIRAVKNLTSIADNVATTFATITTTDEASADSGTYSVRMLLNITHGGQYAGSANSPASVAKEVAFTVNIRETGATTARSAVLAVWESAVASVNAAFRSIGTVTVTLSAVSSYVTDVQVTIDLTGTSVTVGSITAVIDLVYEGFITPPVIS